MPSSQNAISNPIEAGKVSHADASLEAMIGLVEGGHPLCRQRSASMMRRAIGRAG
jgi:hypothetical protein